MIKRKVCIAIAVAMLMSVFSIPAFAGTENSRAEAKAQKQEYAQKIAEKQGKAKPAGATVKAAQWVTLEKGGQMLVDSYDGLGYVSDYKGAVTEITAADLTNAKVQAIDFYAFFGCETLKRVTIPKTVEFIGPGAFTYCDSLTDIIVDGQNPEYVSMDGVLYWNDTYEMNGMLLYQWPGGKAATSYTIPSKISGSGHASLEGKSIIGVEMGAFEGAGNVQSLTIPTGIRYIGESAFTDMGGLRAFNVTSGNKVYKASSGVLYSLSGATLVQYPAGKSGTSFTVPAAVTAIKSYAFQGNYSLAAITMQKGVQSIGGGAFYDMGKLKQLVVSSANKKYYTRSGVLFTKSKKTLVAYPDNKAGGYYEVPYTTTTIGSDAIYANNLKVLDVPASVKSIGDWGIDSVQPLSVVGGSVVSRYVVAYKAYSDGGLTYVTRPGSVSKPKAKAYKGKKIKVTWKKASSASGYDLYRTTNKKTFKKLKSFKSGKSSYSYTNKGLKKGKNYYYVIDTYRVVKGYKVYCTTPKVVRAKAKR